MRAIQIAAFGGPDVVKLGDIPRPEAGPGQVLVRVLAAGVNPVDWKVREGHLKDAFPFHFPVVLGSEIAGVVEAVGEDVTGFAPGEAVHGATGATGAFAEFAVLAADRLAKVPLGVNILEASALPVAVGTAEAALNAGEVGPGTRVLIHAAAGGVGSITLQLARLRGAEITALASPANLAFVQALGADHAVDRTGDYESRIGGFDVVIDGFGPEAQARSWSLLRPGGILLSLVSPPDQAAAAAHSVRATMVYGGVPGHVLAKADALVESGDLKVTVSRTYPLEEAAAALGEVQRGQVRGKVVLSL
jgi:NADPH:quinone reductase-like Zn-dependent oxidoreductase